MYRPEIGLKHFNKRKSESDPKPCPTRNARLTALTPSMTRLESDHEAHGDRDDSELTRNTGTWACVHFWAKEPRETIEGTEYNFHDCHDCRSPQAE